MRNVCESRPGGSLRAKLLVALGVALPEQILRVALHAALQAAANSSSSREGTVGDLVHLQPLQPLQYSSSCGARTIRSTATDIRWQTGKTTATGAREGGRERERERERERFAGKREGTLQHCNRFAVSYVHM